MCLRVGGGLQEKSRKQYHRAVCLARLVLLSLCCNNRAEIQLCDLIKKGFGIVSLPLFSYASPSVLKAR